jgi:hypothetical protein
LRVEFKNLGEFVVKVIFAFGDLGDSKRKGLDLILLYWLYFGLNILVGEDGICLL